MAHYHICWIRYGEKKLDYLGIASRAEAQRVAEHLKRPDEHFRIIEFEADECSPACYDPKLPRKRPQMTDQDAQA